MQYLQKNMGLKWFFCLQINTKVFYKVIVLWMCVTRLARSTQSNKFEISLQYLKENGKNELDFLLVDKHQWYYHFRCVWPGMPKLHKITSLLFLCNILRKKWEIKLIFCMQLSMKVSYKLILSFITGMVKQSQSSQNSKFAMFLQYLKKEVRDEADITCRKTSKISSNWNYHFCCVWPSMPKLPEITSLLFLCNIVRKK